MNNSRLNERIEIVCTFCDRKLKSKVSFQYHLNTFHSDNVVATTSILPKQISSELEVPNEEMRVEALDEHFLEMNNDNSWSVDEIITSCAFTPDSNNSKMVKCVACDQDCPTEKMINEYKLNESLEIPCTCGKVLKNRKEFYKHFVFFHGGGKDQLNLPPEETFKINNEICSFTFDEDTKVINCCKHKISEECKELTKIIESKNFEAVNISCICGKILKTRISFQRHFENFHKKTEQRNPKESIILDVACKFTRDSINKKMINCINCIESCPMASKIMSAKVFDELYIPCECGKVLKNRCNFLKHFMIFHEIGLGKSSSSENHEEKRIRKRTPVDEEDDELQIRDCKFTRDEKNHGNLICMNCKEECPFSKKIKASKLNRELNIPCICGKIIKSRKRYFQHYNFAHLGGREKFRECKICGIIFETPRKRFEHEKNAHNMEFKYSCTNCSQTFFRNDYLLKHLESCGRTKKIEENDNINIVMACGICNFIFKRQETFQKHLKTAHVDAKIDDTCYIEKAEMFTENKKKNCEEKCEICQREFSTKISLKRHMDKIHQKSLIQCEKCDESFIHQSTLDYHMVKKHGKKRSFNCEICDYACDKKVRFNAHMAKHKDPDFKFKCPICQQEFNSYDTMTLHRGRHKLQIPYICEYCQKQFILKNSYVNHLKLHTGENLHKCSTCNKEFIKKNTLKAHQTKENH